jgi:intracellular septation protein
MNPSLFVEILPSLLFLAVSNAYNLIYGVIALIISTFLCMSYLYFKQGKVSWILICSFLLLTVFGGLTIYSGDGMFIKMKPTFVNCLFGLVLLIDAIILRKGFLKKMMGKNLNLTDTKFFQISKHLAWFFFCVALTNEVVWRNFSESSWIYFKALILPLINMLFFGVYFFRVLKTQKAI